MILAVLVSLFAGAAVFYSFAASQAWRVERRKSQLEKRRDKIDRDARKIQQASLFQSIQKRAKANGWEGDLAPVVLTASVLYLTVITVLSLFGLDGVIGVVLSLPVSLLISLSIRSSIVGRRRRAFNRQLMQALDLFAAKLKGGLSPVRAIEQVLPSLPQPLRGEFSTALEQHRAAKSLGDALNDISERYPSRAMQMLVVTVRIDEERGGKMADALEQAAENVRRDFELGAEAQAELSQEKGQFYGILGILVLFAVILIGNADPTAKAAYTSASGFIALSVASGNAVFGVVRVLRVFAKARGEI